MINLIHGIEKQFSQYADMYKWLQHQDGLDDCYYFFLQWEFYYSDLIHDGPGTQVMKQLLDDDKIIILDFSLEGIGYNFFKVVSSIFTQKQLENLLYIASTANLDLLADQYQKDYGTKIHTGFYPHWCKQTLFVDLEDYNVTQYVNRQKAFLNLNRRLRPCRVAAVGHLILRDLHEHGIVSFFHQDDLGATLEKIGPAISHKTDSVFALQALEGISKLQGKDLIVDKVRHNINPVGNGLDSPYLYRRTYFSLVNETFVFEEEHFLSEKIFRPIAYKQPFILCSTPGNLKTLRDMGFKTFSPIIDESYDLEKDHSRRINKIMDEVGRLCAMTNSEKDNFMKECKDIIDHNYRHFMNFDTGIYYKKILEKIKEMK